MIFLAQLAKRIDWINDHIGRAIAWLALGMVTVQFIIVVQRYVFGIGSILMQESMVYMHATLFLVGAGYTLLRGGHVRVDIWYRETTPKRKAIADIVGSFIFLFPISVLIWFFSFPYARSSWSVLEGSAETSGIPLVFLLKSVILAFALLIAIQGVSLVINSILVLAGTITEIGEAGGVEKI